MIYHQCVWCCGGKHCRLPLRVPGLISILGLLYFSFLQQLNKYVSLIGDAAVSMLGSLHQLFLCDMAMGW